MYVSKYIFCVRAAVLTA